jgi:hypothetical protein
VGASISHAGWDNYRYPPNPQTQLAFQAMMNALKKKNASRQLKLLDQNAPKNLSLIYFPLQQHVTYWIYFSTAFPGL